MTARRTAPPLEVGTLARDPGDGRVYRWDGDEWAWIRHVVVVGDAVGVNRWRQEHDLRGVDVIQVLNGRDEYRLRGLDGRGVAILYYCSPYSGPISPGVRHGLTILHQRGAVEVSANWRPL